MEPRKRLIVDMDGVLADVYQQFINFEKRESGNTILLEDLNGVDEVKAFPNGEKHVRQKDFFRTAPIISGAQETLKQLHKKYDVFIVSAAMEFPNSLQEKYYWLEEHFPFISWKQIVLCGYKTVVQGAIMIDDHFKNLDYFEGRTLLFTQPHNSSTHEHSHERVNNWEEIKRLLL